MKILVLNAGSSSQKSCLYELGDTLPDRPPEPIWEGKVEWGKQEGVAELTVQTEKAEVTEEIQNQSRQDVLARLLEMLCQGETQVIRALSDIAVVGHRVVHGGQEYQNPTRITVEVKEAIAALIPLAPAHNPANLEGIEAVEQLLGQSVPQVAVFDTAFHTQMPPAAVMYPVPYQWFEQGIRRYGFHGINHQYCAERVAQLLGQDVKVLRIITCHLGNGCSLAAIRDGHSIDTTMGFTPLEGLMMGSRSGSVDPGILIHLMRQGYDADRLDHSLNKESGLKGVSGVSSDMRQIKEAIAQGNARAQLAFEVYVHRLRSQLGSMLAALGGLDVLVFTGGVGEHVANLRELVCEGFPFLGMQLDRERNARASGDAEISMPDSGVRVFVLKAQEDWAIAQACWRLCGKG